MPCVPHPLLLLLAGLLAGPGGATAAPLASGDRIPVGGDGRGLVSLGLSTYPLGFVQLPDAAHPQVFIVAGRFSHEPGLFLYDWTGATADHAPVLGARTFVRY